MFFVPTRTVKLDDNTTFGDEKKSGKKGGEEGREGYTKGVPLVFFIIFVRTRAELETHSFAHTLCLRLSDRRSPIWPQIPGSRPSMHLNTPAIYDVYPRILAYLSWQGRKRTADSLAEGDSVYRTRDDLLDVLPRVRYPSLPSGKREAQVHSKHPRGSFPLFILALTANPVKVNIVVIPIPVRLQATRQERIL